MNSFLKSVLNGSFAVLLLSSGSLIAQDDDPAVAAEPAATPPAIEFHPVRSVFVDEIGRGRDPFFPTSQRRIVIPDEPEVTTSTQTPSSKMVAELELKGISGTRNRRIALINRKTFEEGESGEIDIKGQTIAIRCETITDDAVTITLLSNRTKHVLRLPGN